MLDPGQVLGNRLQGRPVDWAFVCGSGVGLGLLAEPALGFAIELSIPFEDLGLPAPAVEGHGKAIVYGRAGDKGILVQTGRLHAYEGYGMEVCTAPLRAMIACGAKRVLLTAAVGGLDSSLQAGQLVALRDQINLLGPTPLSGSSFLDCSALYDPDLRVLVQRFAAQRGRSIPEVVYFHTRGPQYETPAECEAMRRLGGEVVGMSTTYESLVAAAAGAKTCAIAVVTNVAGALGLSHEEVQLRSRAALTGLAELLAHLLQYA